VISRFSKTQSFERRKLPKRITRNEIDLKIHTKNVFPCEKPESPISRLNRIKLPATARGPTMRNLLRSRVIKGMTQSTPSCDVWQ